MAEAEGPVGPADASKVPRFSGLATFARLPTADQVERWDIGVVGVPFDGGTSYRPGARFGPAAVRQGSRLLRPYNPALEALPFELAQVVDAGDIACTPFSAEEAVGQIEAGGRRPPAATAAGWSPSGATTPSRCRCCGPRRAATGRSPWSTSTRTSTRGTPTSGSASRTGRRSAAPGRRASSSTTTAPTSACGDRSTPTPTSPTTPPWASRSSPPTTWRSTGWPRWCAGCWQRVGDAPVYVSVDIDVLDPAHAPGTGTPEAGGLTSRELLALVRGLRPAAVVGGDVVEVSPAYDHAEITAIAAAHVLYDLVTIMAAPGPA